MRLKSRNKVIAILLSIIAILNCGSMPVIARETIYYLEEYYNEYGELRAGYYDELREWHDGYFDDFGEWHEEEIEEEQRGIGDYSYNGESIEVEQTKSSKEIEKATIEVALAFKKASEDGWNISYSTGRYIAINVNGKEIVTRPDCSGFINAIVEYMGYIPPATSEGRASTYTYTGASVIEEIGTGETEDWIKIPWSKGELQPGDIQVKNGHMEMFMGWYNNIAYGFNMGTTHYINETIAFADEIASLPEGRSYMDALTKYDTVLFDGHNSYSYIWRYIGSKIEDVNNDGEVSLLDIIAINRAMETGNNDNLDLDIDGNGVINSDDTRAIINYMEDRGRITHRIRREQ